MIHVLRTRSPVYSPLRAFSLDLHVLGTPPAFVLSQDQTLQLHRRGHDQPRSGHSCPLDWIVSSWADVLQTSLKALRCSAICFVDLLSSFQRPSVLHHFGRPTTLPASRRGARFLPLPAVSCQGHRFRPRARPPGYGGRVI